MIVLILVQSTMKAQIKDSISNRIPSDSISKVLFHPEQINTRYYYKIRERTVMGFLIRFRFKRSARKFVGNLPGYDY